MAITRRNPLELEAVEELQVDPDRFQERLNRIVERIEQADDARTEWCSRQVRLLKMRRGVRPRKNIPWEGSNNDNMPLIDAVIRRWRPGIANLILRSEPVAHFSTKNLPPGENQDTFVSAARGAQDFYHWLFMSYMDGVADTTVELVDMIGQYGLAYTRQGWDYRTERESRVALVASLFPMGLAETVQAIQVEVEQQNASRPDTQQINPPSPQEIVEDVLYRQYRLTPSLPADRQMVTEAASRILAGAQNIRLVYQTQLSDKPTWKAFNPLDVIRPSNSLPIEETDFCAFRHRLSSDDILRMARDGWFNPERAGEVAEKIEGQAIAGRDFSTDSRTRRTLEEVVQQIQGVDRHTREFISGTDVWEIFAKLDINGDGIAERVILWYARSERVLLAAYEHPFPFREWPVTEFRFERSHQGPYASRGIAAMLETHQKLQNMMTNARHDAMQVVLSPMFTVRAAGNERLWRKIRFRPGAKIPVSEHDDIKPLVMDTRAIGEFLREEQYVKALAEQYVGIFDPSLTQLEGSGRERRTATEIDAVVGLSTEVQSQDAQLFQLSMAKVHRQLWDLWEDFGPEEVYFRVKGEERPQLALKADLTGDYDIVPAGSPTSTNRALILQRATQVLQVALQDQTGLIDKHEAFREFFAAQDINMAERLVRDPKEAEMFRVGAQVAGQLANQEVAVP